MSKPILFICDLKFDRVGTNSEGKWFCYVKELPSELKPNDVVWCVRPSGDLFQCVYKGKIIIGVEPDGLDYIWSHLLLEKEREKKMVDKYRKIDYVVTETVTKTLFVDERAFENEFGETSKAYMIANIILDGQMHKDREYLKDSVGFETNRKAATTRINAAFEKADRILAL